MISFNNQNSTWITVLRTIATPEINTICYVHICCEKYYSPWNHKHVYSQAEPKEKQFLLSVPCLKNRNILPSTTSPQEFSTNKKNPQKNIHVEHQGVWDNAHPIARTPLASAASWPWKFWLPTRAYYQLRMLYIKYLSESEVAVSVNGNKPQPIMS